MKRAAVPLFLGLLWTTAASAAAGNGCSVHKGLYDGWLALSKKTSSRASAKDSLLATGAEGAGDPDKRKEIRDEYQAYFDCLADATEHKPQAAVQAVCDEGSGDRLATVVCQTALYIKGGRTGGKEFVDAIPSGRKGAEMIWDLDVIAPRGTGAPDTATFPARGLAYKLIDELFVLVLDNRDNAAAKYFGIASAVSDEPGRRHTDAQIKVLFREAPAVVVKEWVVLRQHQPLLKRLVAEMASTLSREELRQMRQGVAGFCNPDNLDCPEILRLVGRPE